MLGIHLSNLDLARYVSALDRYWTDSFIQHKPRVPDGTERLRAVRHDLTRDSLGPEKVGQAPG
jgi:predicted SnoaL-like aldol condensation-catalyzing enzyme